MTRGGTRPIAVLATIALLALLLGACGSSDSSSSDSGSTSGSTSTETNAQGGDSQGGQAQEQNDSQQSDTGGGAQKQQDNSTGFSAKEVEVPLKVSGGGSEQFRTKGGDNSIQEFGDESDESELEEAAETVHRFFVARATGDWNGACSYMSKGLSKQLEQLAASSTELANKGCASFLQAFTSELSAPEWRELTTIDAGSLRNEGDQAFLIYYGPDKTVYAMPLAIEDGKFKIGALASSALS